MNKELISVSKEENYVTKVSATEQRRRVIPNKKTADPVIVNDIMRNTSKYKGVSWEQLKGKWKVRIRKDGKYTHIAYVNNEIEGAKLWDDVALSLHGIDYIPYLNFPDEASKKYSNSSTVLSNDNARINDTYSPSTTMLSEGFPHSSATLNLPPLQQPYNGKSTNKKIMMNHVSHTDDDTDGIKNHEEIDNQSIISTTVPTPEDPRKIAFLLRHGNNTNTISNISTIKPGPYTPTNAASSNDISNYVSRNHAFNITGRKRNNSSPYTEQSSSSVEEGRKGLPPPSPKISRSAYPVLKEHDNNKHENTTTYYSYNGNNAMFGYYPVPHSNVNNGSMEIYHPPYWNDPNQSSFLSTVVVEGYTTTSTTGYSYAHHPQHQGYSNTDYYSYYSNGNNYYDKNIMATSTVPGTVKEDERISTKSMNKHKYNEYERYHRIRINPDGTAYIVSNSTDSSLNYNNGPGFHEYPGVNSLNYGASVPQGYSNFPPHNTTQYAYIPVPSVSNDIAVSHSTTLPSIYITSNPNSSVAPIRNTVTAEALICHDNTNSSTTDNYHVHGGSSGDEENLASEKRLGSGVLSTVPTAIATKHLSTIIENSGKVPDEKLPFSVIASSPRGSSSSNSPVHSYYQHHTQHPSINIPVECTGQNEVVGALTGMQLLSTLTASISACGNQCLV